MKSSFTISKESLTSLLAIIDAINEAEEVIVEDKGKATIRLKPDIKDGNGKYVVDNFFRLKCLFSDKVKNNKQRHKFDSAVLDINHKGNFL